MKINLKKLLCLLFALTIVFASASCGGDNKNENPTENNPAQEENENENAASKDPKYISDLGENDFNGYEFHVLGREIAEPEGSWNTWEIYAENENGDLINDAVYKRNAIIEDKYNVKIKQTRVRDTLLKTVRTSVQSGDVVYDLILPPMKEAGTLATDGSLVDLKTIPNLDLTKGYWNQNLDRYTSIYDKLFYCSGDLNIMDKQATWVLYFNKQLLTDLGLDSPYNLVRKGDWTMDAYNSMLKDASIDLNGDGKYDMNDRFGLLTHDGGLSGFNYYAGEPMISKLNTGEFALTFNNERTLNAINKGIDMLSGDQVYLFPDWKIGQDMFEAGQALFYLEVLDKTGQLRNMEIPFGVVPFPKLNEEQPQYNTCVADVAQLFCIPANNTELERTGFVLEALAAESVGTLKEAYYDKNLTVKFVRDEESVEMIELIMEGIIYDLGYIYNFGNMNGIVLNSIKKKQNTFASDYEKGENAAQSALNKILDAIANQ
ncbi:MAG: extracellular solute-binding protein [Oscillospiraceae bacterium]|nr:extracellular solute-binding protein [Oscillospiraceae bacterium]